MFGGKPVTVQMASGGNKTLTLVQSQQGVNPVGKIVRIASGITSTGTTDQPKLMVVPRQKQPSATIGNHKYNNKSVTHINLKYYVVCNMHNVLFKFFDVFKNN